MKTKEPKRRVIYFIPGARPTQEQLDKMFEFGASLRNARLVNPGDAIESCDAILGGKDIPECYLGLKGVSYPDLKDGGGEKVDPPNEREQLKAVLENRNIEFAKNASLDTLKRLVGESDPLG